MTHIPDEAVQAAMDKCNDVDWVSALAGTGLCGRELIVSALTAAYPYLSAPCAVEVPTKEERHANTARNLIINQTSTDLENIINGHDPEQSILNNDVWDRLDKMACEIEALTKPVDVAAVRRQALEEAVHSIVLLKRTFSSDEYAENQPIGSFSEIFACDEILRAIRAISDETPLKGQQHDK